MVDEQRSERIEHLLQKFRSDSLTVDEARELLGYVREDLERAQGEGKTKLVHVLRRYRDGLESYIALREPSSSGVPVTP